MTDEKQRALEAAGWRVGTVQEFLGLTDADVADIEDKLDRDLPGVTALINLDERLEVVETHRDEDDALVIVHDEAAVIVALAPEEDYEDPAWTGIPRTQADESFLVTKMGMTMLEKLQQHRSKGHWAPRSMAYLRRRIPDEVSELFDAIDAGDPPEHVWGEAADVSNFLVMLADNYAAMTTESDDDDG